MQEEDERIFIQKLKQGDRSALERFVTMYQGQVYRICLRVLKNESEAEDMAQETFLRACKALPIFRQESGISTWLLKIALNVSRNRYDYLKRRQMAQHRSMSDFEGDHWQLKHSGKIENPEQHSMRDEAQVHLEIAFARLCADHRLLLNLRDAEELSYQEITEVTGLPEGTIKSKLHRARKQLAQNYEALQLGESDESD